MSTWITSLLRSFTKPLQWWIVIAIWEQGLRVRLGKTAIVLHPGVHLRIPYLDRVYVQSTRHRTLVQTHTTVTTLDKRTLTFGLAVSFSIKNIENLFNSLSTPEATILAKVGGGAANFISAHNRIDISLHSISKAACNSLDLEAKKWGINKVEVLIVSFSEARTYRLLGDGYTVTRGLSDLEDNRYNGSR